MIQKQTVAVGTLMALFVGLVAFASIALLNVRMTSGAEVDPFNGGWFSPCANQHLPSGSACRDVGGSISVTECRTPTTDPLPVNPVCVSPDDCGTGPIVAPEPDLPPFVRVVGEESSASSDILDQETTIITSGGNQDGLVILDPELNIAATPILVRAGASSLIQWETRNMELCEVTGPAFAESGVQGSSEATNILSQSTYTLSCSGLDGQDYVDETTVRIAPVWQEF